MRILINNCDDVEKPWLMSENDECIYDGNYNDNDVDDSS